MDKVKKIGELRFCLDDYRETEFNESVDCTFGLWGKENEINDVLSIEEYWRFCCHFAAAMGFGEEVIRDWFGQA